MIKRTYRIIAIVLTLILVTVIIFFMRYILLGRFYESSKSIEFSQNSWNENPEDRSKMVNDLLKDYQFLTMTKDDVIKLLGENDLTIGNETLRYEINGGYLRDEVLVFIFDDQGKITDVGIAN